MVECEAVYAALVLPRDGAEQPPRSDEIGKNRTNPVRKCGIVQPFITADGRSGCADRASHDGGDRRRRQRDGRNGI